VLLLQHALLLDVDHEAQLPMMRGRRLPKKEGERTGGMTIRGQVSRTGLKEEGECQTQEKRALFH
jgi:hypothetical protein